MMNRPTLQELVELLGEYRKLDPETTTNVPNLLAIAQIETTNRLVLAHIDTSLLLLRIAQALEKLVDRRP